MEIDVATGRVVTDGLWEVVVVGWETEGEMGRVGAGFLFDARKAASASSAFLLSSSAFCAFETEEEDVA